MQAQPPWSQGISLGWEAQRLPGHNRSLILILTSDPTSGDSPGPFLLAEWELFHPKKVQSLLKSGGCELSSHPGHPLAEVGSFKGETLEHLPPPLSISSCPDLAQTTLETRLPLP